MIKVNKIELNGGINLYLLPMDKFKTITISYCFHRDLDLDYTYNALIPSILKRGCDGFETTKEIERYLESQYGALFDAGVQKRGERQILRFSMDVVEGSYVGNNDVLAQSFDFLNRIISKPIVEEGCFKRTYVEQEAINLKNKIESLLNDKIEYSMERCVQEMCKDEKYGRYVFGGVGDIDALDYGRLYKTYTEMAAVAPLDIFVVGNIVPDKVVTMAQNSFLMNRDGTKIVPSSVANRTQVKKKTVVEEMDVTQGKLVIGFRTNTVLGESDYFPLVVYASILGGGTHSKLFINVREKASLAYYAFARLEKFKGLMFLGAGIETDKYDEALNIMMQQVQDIDNGDISEHEITSAVNDIVTSLKGAMDQPEQLIDFFLNSSVGGCSIAIDEFVERIRSVSKERVIEVAKKIQLDTVYFLRGKKKG